MTLVVIGPWLIGLCLLIGALFLLVGALGLLKFDDAMTRMHAPTKVGTLGVGSVLMASMIEDWTYRDGSLHEILIMAFLFVTAPISANFIAKVHIHRRTCKTPPTPPHDRTWSTLDIPEADRKLPYIEPEAPHSRI